MTISYHHEATNNIEHTAVEKALMKLWRLNVQLQKDTVVYKNMSRIDYSCGVAKEDLGL